MPTSKKHREKTSPLSLPTTPLEPSDNLFDYNVAIFGRKGIGKSTLGAQWPNCLTFRFERGRENLPIKQVPEAGKVLTWTTFLEYLDLFCESDYEFASFDSIDICYDKAKSHVCKMNGVKNPQEAKNSYQIWEEIAEEFVFVFDKIQDAGKHFITLSHDKARKYKNVDNSEYEIIEMTLSPSPQKIIKERCDFVFYYGYASNDRVITIRNDSNLVECAAGVGEFFLDPDGTPLKRFEVPNNPKEVLPTIERAWSNELRDYDYEPPKKPSSRRRRSRRGLPSES